MIRTFIEFLLAERLWSWSVAGIAYLVLTLVLRHCAFGSLPRELRSIDSELNHAVKKLYLRNSIAGWVLYLISFLLVIGVWIGWREPRVPIGALALFCLLLPLLFGLSVILHLRAFAQAILTALRQRMGPEKEF